MNDPEVHPDDVLPVPPMIRREERQFATFSAAKAAYPTLDDRLHNVFNQPRFEQRTSPWYKARNEAITASDFGAAACVPKCYSTQLDVFRKKTEGRREELSDVVKKIMEHGVKYEDAAAYRYEQETGNTILDFGLLSHWKLWEMRPASTSVNEWFDKIHQATRPDDITEEDWERILDMRWLKGSPDGITTNGILIEIKCPISAFTPGHIKPMYMAQVQLNMEVAGVDTCHFIQYIPRMCHYFGERYDCIEVKRDPDYFTKHKAKARDVWDWVLHFRRTGNLHPDLLSKLRVVDKSHDGVPTFESTRKRSQESLDAQAERTAKRRALQSTTTMLEFAEDEQEWAPEMQSGAARETSTVTIQKSSLPPIIEDDDDEDNVKDNVKDNVNDKDKDKDNVKDNDKKPPIPESRPSTACVSWDFS